MEAVMSATDSERPEMDDDLDQAYARAHALADEGRGPSASVRANVLAAAREVAAQATPREPAPPLVPVAPPVAAVGRERAMAVNFSSWRVRSGAAVCAALLVAVGVWRFDETRHADGGVQVATASLELSSPPVAPVARELPVPALPAASTPWLPPPVVDDPLASTRVADAKAAKAAPRDKDLVVAQADTSDRAPRPSPAPEARRAAFAAAPAIRDTANAAPAASVAPAPAAPPAEAVATPQPATTVTVTASVAPQLATLPPMPPSVVQRRVPVAAEPGSRSTGEVTVASADAASPRVEITGSSIKRLDAPAASKLQVVNESSLAAAGARARQAATPLHTAADRGDVEALKTLLAAPGARVDAPDATGRSALLHAVLAQQAGAVRVLLAAGADPARADSSGLTPRAAAQAGPNAEIAALLGVPH
jgi:hypothetical protein